MALESLSGHELQNVLSDFGRLLFDRKMPGVDEVLSGLRQNPEIDLGTRSDEGGRLVHNHPSGDPNPSRDYIAMMQQVMELAAPPGVALHDHIVVGRDGHVSFKERGLI